MTSSARRPFLLFALALAGFSPFQAEERNVREGNERVAAGDPAGALPHYDAAERAAGPRPEIEYDRGVALHRDGRSADARDAFRRALERGAGPLSSRASQNLGNALAALGDREGAKQAYVEALRQDPRNDDARFNLEVLLRKEQDERKEQDQQRRRDPQSSQQEQRENHGGQRHDPARTAKPREQRDLEREAEAAQERARAGPPAGAMSRREAERILDAFRSRERVMPLAGKRRRSLWGGHDQDW